MVATNSEPRVALVTGASEGIGRATAAALARAGFRVAVNYHTNRRGADATLEAVEALGGTGIVVQADVSNFGAVQAMISRILEEWRRIDVLVCNAGVNQSIDAFELEAPDWERIIATNLKGAFNCVRHVVEPMRHQGGGHIVTVSSDCGKRGGLRSGVHFSASKAGMQALAKGLARQLAEHNILVNDVSPADIHTERWERDLTSEKIASISRNVPLGRAGRPEDVAEAILFLVENNSFITGATIDVSGGSYM